MPFDASPRIHLTFERLQAVASMKMKRRIACFARIFGSLTLAALLVVACSRPNPVKISNTDTKTIQIPVEGMVCGACVSNVKRGLKSQKGVEEVEVSLEKRQAIVRYDGAATNPEQLTKIIRDLGYMPSAPAADPK